MYVWVASPQEGRDVCPGEPRGCALSDHVFSSKKENTVDSAHLPESQVDVPARKGRLTPSVRT